MDITHPNNRASTPNRGESEDASDEELSLQLHLKVPHDEQWQYPECPVGSCVDGSKRVSYAERWALWQALC